MRYFVTFPSGESVEVALERLPNGELAASVGGRRVEVETMAQDGSLTLRIDGRIVDLWLDGRSASARGVRFSADVVNEQTRDLEGALGSKTASGEETVVSPMPGRVLKVLVKEGDEVTAGMPVVVVEAMKMENELAAGRNGKVLKILVTPGQTVEGGARLVEIG